MEGLVYFSEALKIMYILTSVGFHVLIEVLFHIEVFTTPLAHELLMPDVDAHVGTKLVLVLKPFVTVLETDKWDLFNCLSHKNRADTIFFR